MVCICIRSTILIFRKREESVGVIHFGGGGSKYVFEEY